MTQTTDIVARLRSAILDLELAPGERLTERGLEAALFTSRTPVRSALTTLLGEGLVQREGRNGRGWVVAPIDVEEIRSLAELREAVEMSAVRLAVARASDAGIDRLVEKFAIARSTAESHASDASEEEGVRAGHDFHVSLAALSGNALMTDAVRDAMNRLARTRWLEVRTPESRALAWDEHHAVLTAVQRREADEAAELVSRHIRDTNERLVQYLTGERRRLRGHGLTIIDSAVATTL